MPDPCRCDAYTYPHRHGGGFCEAPEFVCKDPDCRHGFSEDEAGREWEAGDDPDDGGGYRLWCPVCGTTDPEDMT